jgi:hypothetical protein
LAAHTASRLLPAIPATSRQLILAEVKVLDRFATQRLLQKLFAALRTQIEAELLIHFFFGYAFGAGFFHAGEHILNFLQAVAVIVSFVQRRIQRSVHFHFYHVAHILFRIDQTLAQITYMLNHRTHPTIEKVTVVSIAT